MSAYELKCSGCGSSDSSSQCSRCGALYCNRDCQVKNWPEHKKICVSSRESSSVQSRESSSETSVNTTNNATTELTLLRERMIEQLFDRVCKIIAGNIIILNAWYRQTGGFVEIEISELLSEFSHAGTHFLHMKYVDSEEDVKYSDPSKCFVKFNLNNFSHERAISIKLPAHTVKSKHIQPSREWTLVYEV